MTPKDKAKELLDKFTQANAYSHYAETNTIDFVLICIDEIISEIKIDRKCDWVSERRDGEENILYWLEVKKEIENYNFNYENNI